MQHKLNISKRLLAIARMVDKSSSIIDVGCDHALLDIYLSQNKQIKNAIASDIKEGAINQAKKNVLISNANNVDVRLGDGLKVLNEADLVDTIVISGMGSQKIISILKENNTWLKKINTIIIQSNKDNYNIRKAITSMGYYIKDESLVEERQIIYVIIKFEKGKLKYSNKQLRYGPVLLKRKDDLFIKMIKTQVSKNDVIIKKLPFSKLFLKASLKIKNFNLKKEIR